jgi:hypothetical protein
MRFKVVFQQGIIGYECKNGPFIMICNEGFLFIHQVMEFSFQ